VGIDLEAFFTPRDLAMVVPRARQTNALYDRFVLSIYLALFYRYYYSYYYTTTIAYSTTIATTIPPL